MRAGALSLTVAVACAAWIAACGTSRRPTLDEPEQPGIAVGEAGAPASCQGVRCSPDLKRVQNGCGEVIEQCGPDFGCANGTCIEACASAAAAFGSTGCSFWTLPPDTPASLSADGCFAVTLSNTWDKPVRIQADYDGAPIDLAGSVFTFGPTGSTLEPLTDELPPGDQAVVFLSQGQPRAEPGFQDNWVPCPEGTKPALPFHPAGRGTSMAKAIHVATDAPVSAYSAFPYGGATSYIPSATLLLPVASWGVNYMTVDGWDPIDTGNPFVQLVASEDDTEVRIRPSVDVADGAGVVGAARGVTTTYALDRGEVLQLTQRQGLSGSVVETSKPIGLFGGMTCMNIPTEAGFCDAAQQQIAPLGQWGSRYALVPHRSRLSSGGPENVPWRLVGAVDGTILQYDPAPPAAAPLTLQAGETRTFWSSEAFVVRSKDASHPIYAAAYMTGALFYDTLGDPEYVNAISSDQYLDRYVFSVDATYAESWIDLVRQKGPTGFASVSLECAPNLEGWQNVGTTGEFQSLSVRLTGALAATDPGRGCGYGRHAIESASPFAITVWGIDAYASYAYPGGSGSRPVTDVRIEVD